MFLNCCLMGTVQTKIQKIYWPWVQRQASRNPGELVSCVSWFVCVLSVSFPNVRACITWGCLKACIHIQTCMPACMHTQHTRHIIVYAKRQESSRYTPCKLCSFCSCLCTAAWPNTGIDTGGGSGDNKGREGLLIQSLWASSIVRNGTYSRSPTHILC
jgi:hypothetical protein